MKTNSTFFSFKHLALVASLLVLMVSCYEISSIEQEHTATTNGSFNTKITVKGSSDADHGVQSQYCFVGVLIPEGWSVTYAKGAVKLVAGSEGSIIVDNGTQYNGNGKYDLTPSARYTELLEHRYAKAGFKWVGLVTTEKVAADFSENKTDRIECSLTINTDGVAGDYTLSYVIGDTMDDPTSIDKVPNDWDGSNSNTRSATFTGKSGEIAKVINADTRVTVTSASSVNSITKDSYELKSVNPGEISLSLKEASLAGADVTIYKANGTMVSHAKVNGDSRVFEVGASGMYIVNIVKNGKNTSQKVLVK